MSDGIYAPAAGALVRIRARVTVCAGKRNGVWCCDDDFAGAISVVGVL